MNYRQLISFFCISILLFGCSEQPHQVNGEAFLVRAAGNVFPVAGLDIYVVPDSSCKNFDAETLTEALWDSEVQYVTLSKDELKKNYESLNSKFKKGVNESLALSTKYSYLYDGPDAEDYKYKDKIFKRYLTDDMTSIFDTRLRVITELRSVAARWSDEDNYTPTEETFAYMLRRLKTLYVLTSDDATADCSILRNSLQKKSEHLRLYYNFKNNGIKTSVGIDGKFTCSIPTKGDYHFLATYEDIGAHGVWFVPLSILKDDKVVTVTLNNKNFIQHQSL
jgi:hypothetical protein